mgnify:CR=1 FL=1
MECCKKHNYIYINKLSLERQRTRKIMNVISVIVEYKGTPIKIEGGRIFVRAFGTTISNKSMHWSWIEVSAKDLQSEVITWLKEKRLI